MNSAAPPSGPLLRLSNINTFYGQAQVAFDLSIECSVVINRVSVAQCQRQIDDVEDYFSAWCDAGAN